MSTMPTQWGDYDDTMSAPYPHRERIEQDKERTGTRQERERDCSQYARAHANGWPHANSDFVLDATIRWIDNFGQWPGWLSFPDQVAADLIRMGKKTRTEVEAAGYRSRRERRAS